MMPRRTKRQRQREKRLAASLAGVLLLAVFSALMLTVPAFDGWVRQVLGIRPPIVVQRPAPQSAAAVHIIDVGQGDAALLEADGEYALIDAGTSEAADTLVAYLRAAGVQSLRYLFMTHPHADHIGGMRRVVQEFAVERVVLPRLALAPSPAASAAEAGYPTTSIFEELLAALTARDIAAEEGRLGGVYPLGGGSVSVVHDGLPAQEDYNLLSLCLLFEAGGMRFLDTGDAETENEAAMLESGADVRADVFAAGHHGSSTSNSAAFIQAVAPRLVVVSCGAGNGYGHPHASPLQAYASVGAAVLRTDLNGHVVVQPDGAGGVVYAADNLPKAA